MDDKTWYFHGSIMSLQAFLPSIVMNSTKESTESPYYTPTHIGYMPLGFLPLPSSFITSDPSDPGSPYLLSTPCIPTPPVSLSDPDNVDQIIQALGSPSWLMHLAKLHPEVRCRNDLLALLRSELDFMESRTLMSIRERRRWEAYKRDVSPCRIKAEEPLAQAQRRKVWEKSIHQEQHRSLSTTRETSTSNFLPSECSDCRINADCGDNKCHSRDGVDPSDSYSTSNSAIDLRSMRKRQAFLQRRLKNVEEKRLRANTPSILEETLDKICMDSRARLMCNTIQARITKDGITRKIERVYQMAKSYLTVVKFEVPNLSRIFKGTISGLERPEKDLAFHAYSIMEDGSLGDSESSESDNQSSRKIKAGSASLEKYPHSKKSQGSRDAGETHIMKGKTKEAEEAKGSKPKLTFRRRSPNNKCHHRGGGSDPIEESSHDDNQQDRSNHDAEESRGRSIQKTLPQTRESPRIPDQGEGSSWRPPKERRSRRSQVPPVPKARETFPEEMMSGKLLSEDGLESKAHSDSDDVEMAPYESFGLSRRRALYGSSNRQKRKVKAKAGRKEDNNDLPPPSGFPNLLRQSKSSVPTSYTLDALDALDQHVRDCQGILSIAKASRIEVDPDILCNTSVDVFLSEYNQKKEDIKSIEALKRVEKAQQRLWETEAELKRLIDKRAQKEEKKRLKQEAYAKVLGDLKADHSRIIEIMEGGTDEDLYAWLKQVWDRLAEVELVKVGREECQPREGSCRWM